MKSYDVFMDTFVNVMLPDDVDPDSEAGIKAIYEAAITKYRVKLQTPAEITLTWERFEEGDE